MRHSRAAFDIVRKALGGHEIATVQATAIDKEAGTHPPHHHARPFVWGVAVVGMAGLPDCRDGGAAADGRGATRCSPLLALQARTISMRRISTRRPERLQMMATRTKAMRRKQQQRRQAKRRVRGKGPRHFN
jgi:hypothetical protein